MATELFHKNIRALTRGSPDLADTLMNAETSDSVSVQTAKSGEPVPAIKVAGRDTPLHSMVNPVQEGIRLARAQSYGGYLIFLGIGAGYHICPHLENPNVSRIVLVDNRLDIVRSVLSHADLSRLFLDKRVHIFIDPEENALKEFLVDTYMPLISGSMTAIPLRSMERLEEEFFQKIRSEIKDSIEIIQSDFSTQARFGKRWFANTLLNLRQIERSGVDLAPADHIIITSAGPSLEDNMARLKSARKTAFVIAVDTSLPVLLANGVIPDCVLSIDCQHVTYHHFMAGYPQNVPLILDIASPPPLARISAPLIFFTSGNPLSRYIADRLLRFPQLDTSGGNVTHAAVSLAFLLDAGSITLFGADFSFPGGKTYARGAYVYPYFQSKANRCSSLESRHAAFLYGTGALVPENSKGERDVYSTALLRTYRRNLSLYVNREGGKMRGVSNNVIEITRNGRKRRQHSGNAGLIREAAGLRVADFLSDFCNRLRELPDFSSPLEIYIEKLNDEGRSTLFCLFPVAASFFHDTPQSAGINSLKKARAWAMRTIENVLSAFGVEEI